MSFDLINDFDFDEPTDDELKEIEEELKSSNND